MKIDAQGKRALSWEVWWAVAGSIVAFVALIEFAPLEVIADAITRGRRWDYLGPLLAIGAVFIAVAIYLWRRGERDGDPFPLHRGSPRRCRSARRGS